MRRSLLLGIVLSATVLGLLVSALPVSAASAPVEWMSSHNVVLFADDFAQDTSLNTSKWSEGGSALRDLAAASSSPGSTFVHPKLQFVPSDGVRMSGPAGDYQFSGIASRSWFHPPFALQVGVTAKSGCADVFDVYLTDANLGEYAAVFGNFPSSNGPYYGVWATYSPTYPLYQFGPELNSTPSYDRSYEVGVTISAGGDASVTLRSQGVLDDKVEMGDIGSGPFRVTLAERIGLPYCTPGPMSAIWHSISITREIGKTVADPADPALLAAAQVRTDLIALRDSLTHA